MIRKIQFTLFTILFCLPMCAFAAVITVNDLNDDTTAGNSKCTLREAINNANSNSDTTTNDCAAGSGSDLIHFSVSGIITLGSALPDISDTNALTIDGAGQTIEISGNNAVKIVRVNSGTTLNLNALTVSHAKGDFSGAVLNVGSLNVSNCTFSDNTATLAGAAITTSSSVGLIVTNSTFFGNSAVAVGGAILIDAGPATITNSTFSFNSAGQGGGIYNHHIMNLLNTILADNSGGDCANFNIFNTNVNNLIKDNSCSPAYSGDPMLGSPFNNGGPTKTMALLTGSPAIDKYNDAGCGTTITTDQRGEPRPASGGIDGTKCDIGAFEVQPAAPCPQSQGFWKNHEAAWPVISLTLGDESYTKTELLAILRKSDKTIKNDASLILAVQLIAAKLNVANGSPDDAASLIAQADALLAPFAGKLPYNVKPSSATGKQMVALAAQLENYNKGLLTAGCGATASITIIKDVLSSSSSDSFDFVASGQVNQNFSLVDNGVVGPDRITFSGLTGFGAANSVVMTELPSNYSLIAINCSCVSDTTCSVSFNLPNHNLTFTPSPGDILVCTFVNAIANP